MDIREIELTQGQVALVDAADYSVLMEFKWCASKSQRGKFVAVRGVRVKGCKRLVPMHRQILGLEFGDPREGDHRNFDTLDNRRSNLRIVTPAENKEHQPSRGGSSRFVGVTFDRGRNRWRAQIQHEGKVRNLGRFLSEVEAAAARDAWVLAHATAHTINAT